MELRLSVPRMACIPAPRSDAVVWRELLETPFQGDQSVLQFLDRRIHLAHVLQQPHQVAFCSGRVRVGAT